jgi:hypothetical protein
VAIVPAVRASRVQGAGHSVQGANGHSLVKPGNALCHVCHVCHAFQLAMRARVCVWLRVNLTQWQTRQTQRRFTRRLVLVVHYACRDSPALEGAIVKDETLHTLSVAWLAAIVGAVAGGIFGIDAALKAIVAVTAIVVAYIVAAYELGAEDEK